MRLIFAGLAALGLSVAPAHAATLVVESGALIGATGVNVNGTLYDVTFSAGTCETLFSGCDEASDLDFTDPGEALDAAQALLDQVFLDGPQGNFDSSPSLTRGCSNPVLCQVYVPHTLNYFGNPDLAQAAAANNAAPTFANPDASVQATILTDRISGLQGTDTFALFSLAASGAVPEPENWLLMVLGFGALGGTMRHSRRKAIRLSLA